MPFWKKTPQPTTPKPLAPAYTPATSTDIPLPNYPSYPSPTYTTSPASAPQAPVETLPGYSPPEWVERANWPWYKKARKSRRVWLVCAAIVVAAVVCGVYFGKRLAA